MQGSKRDTDVKKKLLNYAGEGEGGMNWENSIETCILRYLKYMTAASPILGATQRDGAVEEGGRRGFKIGGHMCTPGWFMLMYGKNHHNIAK